MLLEATTTQTIIREYFRGPRNTHQRVHETARRDAILFTWSLSKAGSASRAIRLSVSSPGRNTFCVMGRSRSKMSIGTRTVQYETLTPPIFCNRK